MSRIVREALDEIVEPIIYAEALELLEQHQARGAARSTWCRPHPRRSSGPWPSTSGSTGRSPAGPWWTLDGRYTGEMAFYAYGPFKAEAMRELAEFEGIDLAASYAYSDSYTDVPMLEAVGHPVVVNPDRVLARLARDRGWETAFTRPVRMRDRVPVPNLPTAAAATGAGARRHGCCGARQRHGHRAARP